MQSVQLEKSINNSDWVNPDNSLIDVNDLPGIPGYHVLVQPVIVKEKTKGGIIIPEKLQDDIAYLTTVGKVLKLGDLAYGDEDKFPLGKWCTTGDYVCYGKFSGQKLVYKGLKLLLLFDDQIIMKVQSPELLDPTFNLSN
tara:strand:- start:1394 stop:1813 length:420 start_codon:yes stop_codon:yes gene_type:complete